MQNNPAFLEIKNNMNQFFIELDATMEKDRQEKEIRLKEFNEYVSLEAEVKELSESLDNISKEIERLKLAIHDLENFPNSDSDQKRLQQVKDLFRVQTELTGIRFDHSAPKDVVKGFIVNESREALKAFQFSANDDNLADKLWSLLAEVHVADTSKENDGLCANK